MGGENLNVAMDANPILGSPPHGRGKGKDDRRNQQCGGITPAWAGKRTSFPKRLCRRWDHPRVGGEKSTFLNSMSFPPGSPPRRRGKVPNARCFIERQRITPAWAGKSAFRFQSQKASQDHPRVGGEKLLYYPPVDDAGGSPPRGRGKAQYWGASCRFRRITPAWAGKRRRLPAESPQPGDHPRVGGEKAGTMGGASQVQGSPPHGRGKARHLSHGLLPCG